VADDVRGRIGVLWWAFVIVSAIGGFVWYFAIGTFGVVGTVVLVLSALSLLVGTAGGIHHARSAPREAPAAIPAVPAKFVSDLPIKTIEEAAELAERCLGTSRAIYAFLNKTANRSDDAKVLAEYRHKFEIKVSGLYNDLLGGGMSPPDRLAGPALSRDDIHWIALTLGSRGESYSAERLEKLRRRAMAELGYDSADLEAETEKLGELKKARDELLELKPFVNEHPGSDHMTLTGLEQWMEREAVPESTRSRMRATLEGLLKEMDEKGLRQ
jgi:hypothetical protein